VRRLRPAAKECFPERNDRRLTTARLGVAHRRPCGERERTLERADSQIDSAVKEVKSVARTDGPSVQANDASLPASQLAPLDQAAAMVHKRKRMPERLIRAGRFPNPIMEDGGGKPHQGKRI
jgi:hypothetical protein